jgi:BirA family biotin operon repressor/biotin-[acetyl-CoA-carboxylase] ligase
LSDDLLPWPGGTGRIVLKTCDSTMAEAARRAATLDRPTWIMAVEQTAARGRRGKTWKHGPGNFAATFVLRPGGNASSAALRSFAAANALFETLAMFTDRTRLSLKWPNDVLLNGGKVAGILLESTGQGGRIDWLAIGFGVNLRHTPTIRDAAFPPVSLKGEGGQVPDLDEMLSILASNMATQERIFTELGFAPIREGWLRQAARLGEVITATTPQGETTGRFETIDEAGRLVLSTPHGRKTISAAEVHFP